MRPVGYKQRFRLPVTAFTLCCLLVAAGCGTISPGKTAIKTENAAAPHYQVLPAIVTASDTTQLPPGKESPFGWKYKLVSATALRLAWPHEEVNPAFSKARMRISTATDIREACVLQVELAETGVSLGRLDVSYATYFQVYELLLPDESIKEVLRQGVLVEQLTGNGAVGVFGSDDARISEVFRPHLLLHNTERPDLAAAKAMLLNGDAFQTFGWMEGVVMDGLHLLSQNESGVAPKLQKRFAQFFADTSFRYVSANNTPVVNRIANVETMLPFAVYAQYHPAHPALGKAIAFCRTHQNKEGVITGNSEAVRPAVKTEECYTVAYPLAVMGKQRGEQELQDLAVKNLLARTAALVDSTGIWQRVNNNGEREFRNWSRGVAWYLLGFLRSWEQLQSHPQANELKQEFQRAAAYAMRFQNANGLWPCFMHVPETGEETSGSAGIAAALKYGYQLGVLDKAAAVAADRTRLALEQYVTPDGLLTGTSQANKGGEELQRSGLRVISPYTLGFLAFLMDNE